MAERLLAAAGAADGRVFFTNSGTEANEAAFKLDPADRSDQDRRDRGCLPRPHRWGRWRLTGKPGYREPFEPLPGDVEFVPTATSSALAAAVDATPRPSCSSRSRVRTGVVEPPSATSPRRGRSPTEHGALLWLDEVQTGIGRTGDWFASARSAGVVPDVVTVAKGLGVRLPDRRVHRVGVGRRPPRSRGSTVRPSAGNPLATAVANTVLDVIERDGLIGHATRVGAELARAMAELPGVTAVRGRGLLLAADVPAGMAGALARAALDCGVIVNDVRPDSLRLSPPLILDHAQVAEGTAALARAAADCLEAQLQPQQPALHRQPSQQQPGKPSPEPRP